MKILETVDGEKYLRIRVNTDGADTYKMPINVMWSTDSNTEKLDTTENSNINFWTNPDVARASDLDFVINATSLQNNSNKDATYNMHIQNGGVVSLYKGTYNLDVAGTTKVQFDTSSANRIETIKDSTNWTINFDALDDLAYTISGWLGSKGYTNTAEAFTSDNPNDIQTLVQMYAQADVWNAPA